ncbi:MAG: S-methyl-5-thioribose-1-phosphate isomerase [Candidatus Firestonebacteria bacterium]
MLPSIAWKNNKIVMIDQRKLPFREIYVAHSSYKQVAESIKCLLVRGAPAIGVAAAMGVALAARKASSKKWAGFIKEMKEALSVLRASRPTAVNLFWACDRMERVLLKNSFMPVADIKKILLREALLIEKEDLATNRKIADNGFKLFKKGSAIMTICNTGELATAGVGTAFGVLANLHKKGKKIKVLACETRPVLQGARLTAWELKRNNIPFKLITDNMAGFLMSRGFVDGVIAGADRITANGDTANKIGTYQLAILANHFKIPFYIAAPYSTVDLKMKRGSRIPIEERNPEEVTHIFGVPTAPAGIKVHNPAFDVTNSRLITGIITEKGVIRSPYIVNLKKAAAL